jgi:hypothetical protein
MSLFNNVLNTLHDKEYNVCYKFDFIKIKNIERSYKYIFKNQRK